MPSSGAQRLRRLPAMQETRVRSLGREDPLVKEMATHSSTLAWRIPWREEPGGLQSMGSQRVGHDWATSLFHFHQAMTYIIFCNSVTSSLKLFSFSFMRSWETHWNYLEIILSYLNWESGVTHFRHSMIIKLNINHVNELLIRTKIISIIKHV